MSDLAKLDALYQRLAAEQHRLLEGAAERQVVPTDSMLRYIADLERTIAAVDAIIEDAQQNGRRT